MKKSPPSNRSSWPAYVWGLIGLMAAAIIGLVGWWNAWSIPDWRSQELRYEPGPTVLREVRQIGELVGARYYGEVVHSWLEQLEGEDWIAMANAYDEVQKAYARNYDFYRRLTPRREESQIRQEAKERFLGKLYTLGSAQWYQQVFSRLGKPPLELLEEIRHGTWEAFADAHREDLRRLRREYREAELPTLIYLGRGEVWMGYDLAAMADSQFVRHGDTLILQDVDPQVLEAAINPWYRSPEQSDDGRGIPGFEALREAGSVTPAIVQAVKAGCKQDLIRSAFEDGTAELAEQSAEATLKEFFNLLVREADTLSVVDIRPSGGYEQVQAWLADRRIDAAETAAIRARLKADSIPNPAWLQQLRLRAGSEGHSLDWYLLQE